MFFIIGISNGIKNMEYFKNMICKGCGRFGRAEAFMTYSCLSLFFIPIFKWGKKYFIKMSCCGEIFEISPELGREIASGGTPDISDSDLMHSPDISGPVDKSCPCCGAQLDNGFAYCPYCGERLSGR